MSGTGSLMIRNLRKKSDYDKAVITQNDLLRLAIANDANIAEARKAIQQGIPPTALPQTQKSPTELQQDLGLQESKAIENLLQLFKYTEVSTIIGGLTTDEIFVLNQAFPNIKKDLEGKFDIKLITPTFFIEYLKKYIDELNESKGVSTNLSNMTNKFNQLTTHILDIQNYLPSNVLLLQLHRDLQGLALPQLQLQPILDRIDDLARYLPDKTDFLLLQDKTDVDRDLILQKLQDATQDLPSQNDIMLLHNGIINHTIPRDTALERIEELVNSISDRNIRELQEIRRDIGTTPRQGRTPRNQPQGGLGSDIFFEYILDKVSDLPPNVDEIGFGKINNRGRTFLFIRETGEGFNRLEGDLLIRTFTNNYQFKLWCNGAFGHRPSISEFIHYVRTHGRMVNDYLTASPRATANPTLQQELARLNTPPVSPITTTTTETGRGLSRAMSSTNPTTQGDATTTTHGYGIGHKIYSGARPKKVIKTGKGIDLNKEPLYKTFGKFIVSMPNLIDRDVLQFKYPSLSRVPNLEPVSVSEDFKEFFLDCLENGKVNHKILKTLDEGEKKLFEKVVEKAGLMRGLGITKQPNKEDEEEVNRFNILRGEYYAGNNSHQLLDELRKLVIKFIHKGRIEKNQGIQILSNLI